jgi:hypothetical protein
MRTTLSSKSHGDELIEIVRAFSHDRATPRGCPRCGEPELTIEDNSSPPVALWYRAHCPACGLDETIHIPMGVAAAAI